jgi:hypothetical protein
VGHDRLLPCHAQKPIRLQRMLIRDRDSRPCSEISPFSESGLSLLKNPSDHRGCSSATAFVRSRNPVTVISKIESRNLDRAPDMGCPTQWVERDGSRRSDGAIRPLLWLRPRDVRTDDGVHRPREMRRSCQRKAVESSGDPDSLYLATDAFCSDDNKENNKIKRDGGASH